MANLTVILLDGLMFSLLLSFFVSLIQWMEPRMELHNYPKEIRDKVPAKTEEEQQRFKKWAAPMLLFLLAFLVTRLLSAYGTEGKLFHIWIHAFAVFVFFALFDLIVLDWFVFCTITPKYLMIPGTVREDYKNYRYHLRGIGPKGMFYAAVGAFVITGLYWGVVRILF